MWNRGTPEAAPRKPEGLKLGPWAFLFGKKWLGDKIDQDSQATSATHMFYPPGELTYPPDVWQIWRWCSFFARWDMLISWRVSCFFCCTFLDRNWDLKNFTGVGFFTAKKKFIPVVDVFFAVADVKISPNSYILMTCLFSPKISQKCRCSCWMGHSIQVICDLWCETGCFRIFRWYRWMCCLSIVCFLTIISNQIISYHILSQQFYGAGLRDEILK